MVAEIELFKKKPSAIIFDTDNTLYHYDPAHEAAMEEVYRKAQNLIGISKSNFKNAFIKARMDVKKRLGLTASSHSRLLYLQRTLELIGIGSRLQMTLDLEQSYWRTFLNNCQLFPDVLEFIYLLKSLGIATANITDLTAQIQFRKLVYFGLDDFFDFVVTSEEAGRDKPDVKPFELILEKLQKKPSEIWMVGDDPQSDMIGAAKMGIRKIQKIHKGVEVHKIGDGKPDLKFKNYSDLIKIFKKNFLDAQ